MRTIVHLNHFQNWRRSPPKVVWIRWARFFLSYWGSSVFQNFSCCNAECKTTESRFWVAWSLNFIWNGKLINPKDGTWAFILLENGWNRRKRKRTKLNHCRIATKSKKHTIFGTTSREKWAIIEYNYYFIDARDATRLNYALPMCSGNRMGHRETHSHFRLVSPNRTTSFTLLVKNKSFDTS